LGIQGLELRVDNKNTKTQKQAFYFDSGMAWHGMAWHGTAV
jgi:hypothetical protein